jgi:hypothetical protein
MRSSSGLSLTTAMFLQDRDVVVHGNTDRVMRSA